jgi:hypothetical protein
MACQTGKNEKTATAGEDSTLNITADTLQAAIDQEKSQDSPPAEKVSSKDVAKTGLPVVLVYNFHVTNRCVSCIAIEEATTKTLNTYFAAELKQGRIKRQVIDVDDKANQQIAEKYEAFGSGLFITRVYNGKETTTDLTGDGFKFAKNKEERFIEILKSKITEYLK